jgi:NADH dehydrogenase ubiquinone Fe-S protein 4
LIPAFASANRCAMTVARIIEEQRKTTQSGKAQDGRWTLEFERQQPQRPDPLTGWNGSGDTRTQIRLRFDTKEEALAYAARKGFTVHLVPAAPLTLKLQAYADNFR